MKRIEESLYQRGLRGHLYLRKRIPAALRLAYPPHQREIVVNLGTTDVVDGKERLRAELVLFPGLRKNCHGKLSASFGKFFGRYLRAVGVGDKRKVLYSFRHSMKDLMERVQIPSKVLKRTLGHASGDGKDTDGYGSGVPFEVIVEHFNRIQFPEIPVTPWQPGHGRLFLKRRA